MSSGATEPRTYATATTRGLCREINEDATAVAGILLIGEVRAPVHGRFHAGVQLLAIADGMGAHVHGGLASRECLRILIAETDDLLTPAACATALRRANLHLHGLMQSRPDTSGMGTTAAALTINGRKICWSSIGDSRIYRLRAGELEQLNTDDRIGSKGNGCSKRPNALSQCLGGRSTIAPIHPHADETYFEPGDRFLLCSDGLTDMTPDPLISEIMCSSADATAAVARLIECALRAGGRDNISVVVAQ